MHTEEKNSLGDPPAADGKRPHVSTSPKAQANGIKRSEPAAGKGSGWRRGQQPSERGMEELESEGKGERLVDVVLSECEVEHGPRTSSPDNRGNVQ